MYMIVETKKINTTKREVPQNCMKYNHDLEINLYEEFNLV